MISTVNGLLNAKCKHFCSYHFTKLQVLLYKLYHALNRLGTYMLEVFFKGQSFFLLLCVYLRLKASRGLCYDLIMIHKIAQNLFDGVPGRSSSGYYAMKRPHKPNHE
uniref:Uncharacterized protein n=1 Tax=Opuntia streptacantha TaxID=393608 RepID=A0A7C8YI22_OPUST